MSLVLALLLAGGGDGAPQAPQVPVIALPSVARPVPPPLTTLPMPLPHPPRNGVTEPRLANTQQVFNDQTYPYWSKGQIEEGTVRVRAQVSASGVATACEIVRSSGYPNLDQGTCDIVTSAARFLPARDKKSRAVAAPWVGTVTWQMMQEGPWKVESSRMTIVYSLGPARQITGCRSEAEPVGEFDPRSCAEMKGVAQIMVAMSPPDFDWAAWDVVVETTQDAGSGDTAMQFGHRAGEQLFDRDITRLTIDAGGRITKCETIEAAKVPQIGKPEWCERLIRSTQFEPAPGQPDRQMTGVTGVYVRKKK